MVAGDRDEGTANDTADQAPSSHTITSPVPSSLGPSFGPGGTRMVTISVCKERVRAWTATALLALEGDDWEAVCDALLAAQYPGAGRAYRNGIVIGIACGGRSPAALLRGGESGNGG
jgi:hypothetical protein